MYLKVIKRAEKTDISIKKKIKKYCFCLIGIPVLSFVGIFEIVMPCNRENLPLIKAIKETWINNLMPSTFNIILRWVWSLV